MTGEDMAMVIALQNKSAEKLTTSGGASDAGKVLAVSNDGSIVATTLPVSEGTVAVDSTLAISGAAADAKATGDALSEVNASLADIYATDTATGNPATFTDGADDIPVKSLTVAVTAVQSGSGDPAPDNVRPISGWTGATITRNNGTAGSNEETYAFDWTDEAGTVYGGTLNPLTGVLTVDRKAVVINEITKVFANYIKEDAIDGFIDNSEISQYVNPGLYPSDLKSDKLKYVQLQIWSLSGRANAFTLNNKQIHVNIANELVGITDYTSETVETAKSKLNAWLAENPVTIIIPITATTVQLTAQEVTTLLGDNNIYADTGDVSATYRADPTLYINRKIAEAISALS